MRRWVPAIALVVLVAPLPAYPQAKSGNSAVYEQLNLFDEAFQRIRQDAVEAPTDDKLTTTAITGMLNAMDPRAVYMTEAEYKARQTPTPSQSGSIGAVVTIEGGQAEIVSPRDGSPAAAAGIKPGDALYMIDKQPTYDMSLADIDQALRGPVGSKVKLLLRRGSGAPLEVTVTRGNDPFKSVSFHLEGSTVGYIRIAGFDDKSAADLAAAVKSMEAQAAGNKLIGLVLDLRNDPGGNFNDAVATADALLDKGDITVVKGRKADDVKHIAATPGDVTNGLPIVAIVNGGTAREAELLAGALQDNHRAILLGSKTFGESAIETTIPLNGEGAVRLTTARFLTPNGHPIQAKGVIPDLMVGPVKLQRLARGDTRHEADLPGALKNTDPEIQTGAPPAPAKPGPAKPGPAKPGATAPGAAKPGTTEPGQPSAGAGGKPGAAAPGVANNDIGGPSDEQLAEAIDVLHGLAMTSARNTR